MKKGDVKLSDDKFKNLDYIVAISNTCDKLHDTYQEHCSIEKNALSFDAYCETIIAMTKRRFKIS
jgi:hypothetical protein